MQYFPSKRRYLSNYTASHSQKRVVNLTFEGHLRRVLWATAFKFIQPSRFWKIVAGQDSAVERLTFPAVRETHLNCNKPFHISLHPCIGSETMRCKLYHLLQMRSSGWAEETDPALKVSECLTRTERKCHYVDTTARRSS